jgi:hypothetical protein
MDANLRKAWTEVVTGADLDRHLAEVGQAEANAGLLVAMLSESSLPPDADLLLAGVGTGQLLDYAGARALAPYRLTCTDINERFLAELEDRLRKAPELRATVRIDDIEATALRGPYDAVAAILLLEHIEWRKGVAALARLDPGWMYLVIQRNEAAPEALTAHRDLAPSIRAFGAMARPTLVPESELTAFLAEAGYAIHRRYERPVRDEKTMVGLLARRVPRLP